MQYMCLIYDRRARLADHVRGRAQPACSASTARSPSRSARAATSSPATRSSRRRHGDHRPVRDGETLVTDGPFAETKEQLGGYYLVEAKDVDEALAIAARIPSARYGSIEVRPVMVFEG